MPKLNQDLETSNLPTGNFQFSHQRIGPLLGAMEYTIVSIVVDVSGSTLSFRPEMTRCLKEVVKSCKYSKRSDNLMLRLVRFSTDVEEVHGFKLLNQCNLDDYTDVLNVPAGTTALYDACVNAIDAGSTYGADLIKNDYDANGIVVVITDGCNYGGTLGINSVKTSLENSMKNECLQSNVSILIGINLTEDNVKKELENFSKKVGFTQFVDAGLVNDKMLAKLANFVSKSISSQSQALNGPPSQSLTF